MRATEPGAGGGDRVEGSVNESEGRLGLGCSRDALAGDEGTASADLARLQVGDGHRDLVVRGVVDAHLEGEAGRRRSVEQVVAVVAEILNLLLELAVERARHRPGRLAGCAGVRPSDEDKRRLDGLVEVEAAAGSSTLSCVSSRNEVDTIKNMSSRNTTSIKGVKLISISAFF